MSTSDLFNEIVPGNIQTLRPYQPGKPLEELERELGISGAIKLASNENPLGPSPKAKEAAIRAMAEANLYPDGGAYQLRRAVAEHNSVDPSELVFGSGCNEIIHMLVQAYCRPGIDEVLTHKYAFISYRLAALAHNAPFVEAGVTDKLGCDVDALIAAMSDKTRLIFLANPNNPTGAHVTTAQLERVMEAVPRGAILVVDEAYHEYAVSSEEPYPRSQSYRKSGGPMLVTLRTFSKIYGLAGLRVGYGIGDARIIDYVNRVRRPFNVTSVGQAAAAAALDDTDHVRHSASAARSGIAMLSKAAAGLGLTAYSSLGNFVLVDVGRDAATVYDALLRLGVIVRPMGPWGLPQCVRISVGTSEQTSRVAGALETVLS